MSSLEPIDVAPFRRPSSVAFIWCTLLLVWLISLLPWRQWAPAPDLLLLVLAFWCLNEPRRIGMVWSRSSVRIRQVNALLEESRAALLPGRA